MPSRTGRAPAILTALLVAGLSPIGCETQRRATHVIEESGDRALARGDYELAEAEFREIADRFPGDWRSRVRLARAQMGQGKYAEAREQLEAVYTIRPREGEITDALALSMLKSGDVEAMTQLLRKSAQDYGRVSDWIRLGSFLDQAGDHDGAEQAFLTAARIDQGKTAAPQIALADFYASVGDTQAALERYAMALYLDPKNTDLAAAVRGLGGVPGPTFARPPAELAAAGN